MTGVKRGIAAASLKACSSHSMDATIQGFASAMLAVIDGGCIFLSGTLLKALSDPKEQQSRSFGLAHKLCCRIWNS
jgi:hypothetical protein